MLYNILDYGAVGNGLFDNTDVIQNLIDSIEKCGGTILIPSGIFVTGPIRLRDNISLYLENGAVIKAHPNHSKYPQIGRVCFLHSTAKILQLRVTESSMEAVRRGGILGNLIPRDRVPYSLSIAEISKLKV